MRRRRLFDLVAGACALLLAAPLGILIGVAILVADGPPVLFVTERLGRQLRPFRLYKFRTMRPEPGPDLTAAGDRRIFPLGRLLRRTRLDELPQLWNVLRGDMSLVGPRPETARYVRQFEWQYRQLLKHPPGLVDPATLAYLNEGELLAAAVDPAALYTATILPAKLALSTAYAGRRTLSSDVGLLFAALRRLFEW